MSPGRSKRPRPAEEPHTKGYWDAARRREFVIQYCDSCRFWIHPPRFTCPKCQREDLAWRPASGQGAVYAFSIMHMPGGPGFDRVPYGVAIVELDEQPGLITVGNVLDCAPSELRVGMRLRVDFEDIGDGWILPQWRKAAE